MQILHYSLFFLTMTTFANQLGYCTSRTKPATRSLSTSSIARYLSGMKLLFFCQTRWYFESMLNLWVMISGKILGISTTIHANTYAFARRNSNRWARSSSCNWAPICTIFVGSVPSGYDNRCSTRPPLGPYILWSRTSTLRSSLEVLVTRMAWRQCWIG